MAATEIKYKRIWNIAYPIILGSVAQNVINVTDTAFLGRVGEIELGAAAIGGILYLTIFLLALGFGTGAQIIVARRLGEDRDNEVGKTMGHAYYFLIAMGAVVFFLFKYFTDSTFHRIIQSEAIFESSMSYVDMRIWGVFFSFTNVTFRAFFVGTARTKVITYSAVVMTVVNVFLDYCLIFGKLGFPEMGIRGAALASVIAEVSAMLFLTFYTLVYVDRKRFGLFKFSGFSFPLMGNILNISLPIMLQNFFSMSAWLTFFLFVEHMGERQLAISNIIRSAYFLLMIPVFGFAAAANTLVSFTIGKGKPEEVLAIVAKTIKMTLGCVSIIVLAGALFPHQILRIYTDDIQLVKDAVNTFYIVCGAIFFFASSFILLNGVAGTGKTIISLLLEIAAILVYLTSTYIFTSMPGATIEFVWCTEFVYCIAMGTGTFLYLKYGKWKPSQLPDCGIYL